MLEKQAEKIIEIIKKEHEYYKGLLQLSNKKKAIVVEGKVAELEKIVKVEQNLIFDLGQLEKFREQELLKLCQTLQLGSKTTISELAKQLPQQHAQQFLELQAQLSNTINELQNINEINGQLIQQSLEYIEYSVNMLTSVGPTNSLYDDIKSTGHAQESKKRLFDTKV